MKNTELPRVTIVSPFRQNGGAYVEAYFSRAYELTCPARLHWVCVEGDSDDDTLKTLRRRAAWDSRITIVKCDTGQPRYGSTVNPERFKILARVFNAGLDAVDLRWSDYACFIPSDVLYQPDLIDRLASWDKGLIAPMFWANEGGPGRFYDIWGFSRESKSFPPYTPAWFAENYPSAAPFECDTVGGVILMQAGVLAAACRYTPEAVDHGLCWQARAAGFGVWCDPTTHVVHP